MLAVEIKPSGKSNITKQLYTVLLQCWKMEKIPEQEFGKVFFS